jgi:extradiol dioxygenase family protein
MEPILHLSIPVRDLDAAREFYVDALGCPLGRVRAEFIDVWFFGMQLTLQQRPDEVVAADAQGVRHFGVALPSDALEALLARLRAAPVQWIHDVATDTEGVLDGKTSVKVADPSGNVIELKSYPDDGDALRPRHGDAPSLAGAEWDEP